MKLSSSCLIRALGSRFGLSVGVAACPLSSWALLDDDRNGLSDVWEAVYDVRWMDIESDPDGDGLTNEYEAFIGSNPRDPNSGLFLTADGASATASLRWSALPGLEYAVETTNDLSLETWALARNFAPGRQIELSYETSLGSEALFFRLECAEYDTDEDGLEDWEEHLIGFDPETDRTDRWYEDDDRRVRELLSYPSIITVGVLDGEAREDWPDAAVVVLRRSGGIQPISVNLEWSGSASVGVDYVGRRSSVEFAAGQSEVILEVDALEDDLVEGDESISVRAIEGVGYFPSALAAEITVVDERPDGLPGRIEAIRFLEQATFGPALEDLDAVQSLGMEEWIERQFDEDAGYLLPVALDWEAEGNSIRGSTKMMAWWERAVNSSDSLRQRMAYVLSQIFVISDADGGLAGQPEGMLNYYDMLLDHSFGNYRDLLLAVTYHPCMGRYLSSAQNMAADERIGSFPDENYAREVMQLFSIGLWELNPDGSRKLDTNGDPIPTYDNEDIGEFARIFTGLNYEGNNNSQWWRFYYPSHNYVEPLRMWNGPYEVWNDLTEQYDDVWFHDPGEKRLLNGQVVPANQRGEEDISDAIDNLFNHPNVGPFIGLRLIQRFVTSNPSSGYIERVSTAFADNGAGVRGDFSAVLKAVLLDPEARSVESAFDPEFGKVQEPYLRLVRQARVFNASSPSGWYGLSGLADEYGMQPMSSPTVFNFFQPDYQPNGEIKDLGLVAPELQIVNEVNLVETKNHLYRAAYEYYNSYSSDPSYSVRSDYGEALTHAFDPDALVAFLDDKLNNSRCTPVELATVARAINRIEITEPLDRVETAVYLLSTTATASVQR